MVAGVHCDICGDWLVYDWTAGKKYIAEWARQYGWTIGKYCKCPNCAKKKEREK